MRSCDWIESRTANSDISLILIAHPRYPSHFMIIKFRNLTFLENNGCRVLNSSSTLLTMVTMSSLLKKITWNNSAGSTKRLQRYPCKVFFVVAGYPVWKNPCRLLELLLCLLLCSSSPFPIRAHYCVLFLPCSMFESEEKNTLAVFIG